MANPPENRSPAAGSPAPPSALSHPVFRALWLASLGSGIGSTTHDTAAVWSLTMATDRPWMVTLFQALLSAPLFFFALPGGAVADIVDKRVFVLRVNLVGAAVAGAMAGLAFISPLGPGALLAGAFVLGTCMAFGLPAWQSLMPEVIAKPLMASAITLGSIGVNLSRAIGPLFGGLIVGSIGPAPAFAFNAVTFLGVAFVLGRWRRPPPPAKPHAETVMSAMVAAVRHVRHSPSIRTVLIRHALFGLSAIAPVALLPLTVRQLGLPASDFGLLMGAYGAGGIIAALVILPRLRRRWSVDQISFGAGVVAVAGVVGMALAESRGWLAAALFPVGAAWLITVAQMNLAGQSVFPHWIRARASAVQLLAFQGAIAGGSLLWGDLTSRFGVRTAYFGAAAGLLVYLAFTRMLRVDRSLAVDLSPVENDHQHGDLALQPGPDDGPVRIMVRYEVREEDEPGFFRAIAELRDSRLRDGAYRWHLWRDLKHPRVLYEAFLVGSWQEHLRQADRTTFHTREIEQRVLGFHQGATPPEVQHSLHLEPGTPGCPMAGQPATPSSS
jgi:predicted MFS family arabinose efflux permease